MWWRALRERSIALGTPSSARYGEYPRLEATRLYMSRLALSAAVARLLVAQAGHLTRDSSWPNEMAAWYGLPDGTAMGVVRKRMRRALATREEARAGPQVSVGP
jgi:hypothetical protein